MNNHQISGPARDIFKGAIIGAAVATAVAVLMNKDTRDKVTKGVKDAMHEMKKRKEEMKKEAKEKIHQTAERMEESLPKKEEQSQGM